MSESLPRRGFAGKLLLAATATATAPFVLGVGALEASPMNHAADLAAPNDAWLYRLQGRARQLFDAPAPADGVPLVHLMNYYDTYNKSYHLNDRQINGVLTLYGNTTPFALSDAMWTKFHLGPFLGLKDAEGKGYPLNPWRRDPVIEGEAMPGASIEAMQARGATFIVCDNALWFLANVVAKGHDLPTKEVYTAMRANILPGIALVPAMVIAIEKAQRAGLTYHRQ